MRASLNTFGLLSKAELFRLRLALPLAHRGPQHSWIRESLTHTAWFAFNHELSVRRDSAVGVLARVAASLGLEPSAAQLAAAARVRANRGHDTRSAVPGCGLSSSCVGSCRCMSHAVPL